MERTKDDIINALLDFRYNVEQLESNISDIKKIDMNDFDESFLGEIHMQIHENIVDELNNLKEVQAVRYMVEETKLSEYNQEFYYDLIEEYLDLLEEIELLDIYELKSKCNYLNEILYLEYNHEKIRSNNRKEEYVEDIKKKIDIRYVNLIQNGKKHREAYNIVLGEYPTIKINARRLKELIKNDKKRYTV
ncbi:MAG: hypothetical protein ACRDCB_06790 [Clostridium sp.]